MSSNLCPLAVLAAETTIPLATVAQQLGDVMQLDSAGIRCVPNEDARRYIESLAEARREKKKQHTEFVKRLEQVQARHPTRGGTPATLNSNAYADLLAPDSR